jgi:hypothetical protein
VDAYFAWETLPSPAHVQVYLSPVPESESHFDLVFPVERLVEAHERFIGAQALRELLAGPTPAELAVGFRSEIANMVGGPSNCAGQDFELAFEPDGLTLQFCRTVSSGGVGQDARARAEIESTLSQFAGVERIRLLRADEHCLFDLSGSDQCLKE